MSDSKEAKARAEASFKRKEEQGRQGATAWAELRGTAPCCGQKDGAAESTSISERGS
jgi:hypothetical protein